MQSALARRVVLLLLLALPACRSAAPDPAKRTSIPPPWTAEALESHEYLYLELANGKRGVLFQPEYKVSDAGDYLTSKNDATVHLTLSEVRVLDALDVSQESGPSPAQSVAGVLAAFWFGVLLFLPAIALYLILH